MDTFTGIQYIQIDISNNMGHDKESYEKRLEWVFLNEEHLEKLVDLADKPFQYIAAVIAYRKAQKGLPTGHLVGFDACASGIALMAALTGCVETATNTGLIGNERADIYGKATEVMSDLLGSKVEVARKHVKKALMT